MFARARSAADKKTLVKSIRIEKHLNDSLEKLAASRDLTLNSLVSSVLTKYVEWDSRTERYGFVSMPLELFKELLYTDSTQEIEQVGKNLGPRLTKEMLQFWFMRVGTRPFVEYMNLISKYSGMARCDVETDDRELVLTYRHQLGERWSRFIAAYYGETLRKVMGVDPKVDISSSQIVLRWDVS